MHSTVITRRLETLDSILSRLRESIKRSGLKNSKQREKIISVLYRSGTHLSPGEITAEIGAKGKGASISSVYRILSFLEKEKFVTVLEAERNCRRYEIAAKEHHDHIICLGCGNIIEFVDPEIERLQVEVSKKFNTQLVSHDMKLFVVCNECAKKG